MRKNNKKKNLIIVVMFVLVLIAGGYGLIQYSDQEKDYGLEDSEASGGGGGDFKTWAYWWPPRATPTLYKTKHGAVQFLDYNREEDLSVLEQEFEDLVNYHHPDYLVIFFGFSLNDQFRGLNGEGKFPRNGTKVRDLRYDSYNFEYHDDLLDLCEQYGIKAILYPAVSAYGGQVPYPWTYYCSVGWFWSRPDWGPDGLTAAERVAQGYGLADPNTDAMRHPPASLNGSNYNWYSHMAGYESVDKNVSHWELTTNGFENTGLGNIEVYESPNMVYNGYDLGLHKNALHIHTPIPSLSSQAYRDLIYDFYSAISDQYKDHPAVAAYYLFQEPTYAHLRENVAFKSGFVGESGAVDSRFFEVDYSAAELKRYNMWRIEEGLSSVSQVPYPPDSTYKEFKKWNLADFQKQLANEILEKDSDANIMLSIFYDEAYILDEVDPVLQMSMVKPDYFTIESPIKYKKFHTLGSWNSLINSFKSVNPNLKGHISHWIGDTSYDSIFSKGVDLFATPGFRGTEFESDLPENGYAHWRGNSVCNGLCTLRYERPKKDLLDCPKNLQVSCLEGGGVFTWDKVVGVDKYLVRINKAPGNDWYSSSNGDILREVNLNRLEVELQSDAEYVEWSIQPIGKDEVYPYSGCIENYPASFTCGGSCGTCTSDQSCVSGRCVDIGTIDVDLNEDGKLNGKDYSVILNDWVDYYDNDKFNSRSDLNGNGKIDALDYSLFLKGWADYFDR